MELKVIAVYPKIRNGIRFKKGASKPTPVVVVEKDVKRDASGRDYITYNNKKYYVKMRDVFSLPEYYIVSDDVVGGKKRKYTKKIDLYQ